MNAPCRNQELNSILIALANNWVVVVWGEPGIGKSTLVRQIAHFVSDHESSLFENGVVYLHAVEYQNYEELK